MTESSLDRISAGLAKLGEPAARPAPAKRIPVGSLTANAKKAPVHLEAIREARKVLDHRLLDIQRERYSKEREAELTKAARDKFDREVAPHLEALGKLDAMTQNQRPLCTRSAVLLRSDFPEADIPAYTTDHERAQLNAAHDHRNATLRVAETARVGKLMGPRLVESAVSAAADGNIAVLGLIRDELDARRRFREGHALALNDEQRAAIADLIDNVQIEDFEQAEIAFRVIEQVVTELPMAQGIATPRDRIRKGLVETGILEQGAEHRGSITGNTPVNGAADGEGT